MAWLQLNSALMNGQLVLNVVYLCPAGGKILLNNARLHLKRGKRYGLCGPNGAGKSTLMRAISNGQLDGFPPKEELRTVRTLPHAPCTHFAQGDGSLRKAIWTSFLSHFTLAGKAPSRDLGGFCLHRQGLQPASSWLWVRACVTVYGVVSAVAR